MSSPVAVYVHTPFCPTKCGYCDFNSYAMEGDIVERTVSAIEKEILSTPHRGRPAKTIFFGGGTPTFLSASQLIRLLDAVLEMHPPLDGAEITSEANPGTVDATKFEVMHAAGFNRVSLGAQSFLDSDLHRLGRIHVASEIGRAVEAARSAGFDNLNLDLMFSLPGQTPKAFDQNLRKALSLKPEHLSLYCLTLEPNTAFYKEHLRGTLVLPDEETQVETYENCVRQTAEAGMAQYEISNFALPGRECRHNLCYWYGEEYLGYGPGAVGAHDTAGGRVRETKIKHPLRYSEAVEKGDVLSFDRETLTPENERVEKIMLGLRLNAGLDPIGLEVKPRSIDKLIERGWISANGRITLTALGKHFCSEVTLELIQ